MTKRLVRDESILTPKPRQAIAFSILDSRFRAVFCLVLTMTVGFPITAYSQNRNDDQSRHFRITDREAEVFYRRGLAALDANQTSEGLKAFQRVLNSDTDSELQPEENSRFESVRRLIHQRLEQLTKPEQNVLERLVGGIAKKLYSDALETNDAMDMQLLSRRYFYTHAGFMATDWLSRRWMDRGRYHIAARNWQRLLDSKAHRQRISDAMLIRICSANALAGQSTAAFKLAQDLKGSTVRVGPKTIPISNWLAELNSTATQSVITNTIDWRMPLGNPERNRIADASPPFTATSWSQELGKDNYANTVQEKHPASWSQKLARGSYAKSDQGVINQWLSSRLTNRLAPIAAAKHAIVVNNQVVVRSTHSITAFDLNSGELDWEYDSAQHLAKLHGAIDELVRDYERTTESILIGNPTSGLLTSDGQAVFAIEFLAAKDLAETAQTFAPNLPNLGLQNHLVAIGTSGSKRGKVIWSLGNVQNGQLEDHYFLGPPTPVDTELFVLTTFDGRVFLSIIEAATGSIQSSQPIALVDVPVQGRTSNKRGAVACVPTVSDGVVICPTNSGLLVAIDRLSGNFLWSYYCRDESIEQVRRRFTQVKSYGHSGFTNLPLVNNGSVIYLPRFSQFLHCIELSTGRSLWKQPRDEAEFVASVGNDDILVVGKNYCRTLNLASGKTKWKKLFGMPAGHGIALNGSYLLPLKSGRVLNIDIATGRADGLSIQASHSTSPLISLESSVDSKSSLLLGNLIAANDKIVSTNSTSVRAFAQAAPMLKTIQQSKNSLAIPQQLKSAALELVLGSIDDAETRLTSIDQSTLEPSESRYLRTLLRELLYYRLESAPVSANSIYDRIEKLADSPWERARCLLEKSEWQYSQRDISGFLTTTSEIFQYPSEWGFPKTGDPRLTSTTASRLPRLIDGIRRDFAPSDSKRIGKAIDAEWRKLNNSNDLERLKSFVSKFRNWPQSGPAKIQLAQLMIQRRQFQSAEFLLLENRNHSDSTIAATATMLLAELWARLRLNREAAALLVELQTEFADTLVTERQTGQQFVANIDRNDLRSQFLEALKPLGYDVVNVDIQEHRLTERGEDLRQAFQGRLRMRGVDEAGFHLFERGSERNQLHLADKETGVKFGEIRIPPNPWYPRDFHVRRVGHFTPIGTSSALCGISSLEYHDERPLWNHYFEDGNSTNAPSARPGPAGPSFCAFQTRQGLVVIDPVTGRILWKRDDIPIDGGLFKDQYTGLFGDDRVLVLFHPDNKTYTLYETHSGQKIRTAQLDRDMGYTRHAFGRRLCYVGRQGIQRKIRIWDPLTNRFEMDVPLVGRYLNDVVNGDEFAVVINGNRLVIVDVATMKTKLNLPLSNRQITGLNYLRAFADQNNYYVNLQQSNSIQRSKIYFTYISDTYLPSTNIEGFIYAVEKDSGKPLWNRVFPKRTVLRNPSANLPFLVMMSQARKVEANNFFRSVRSLMIEVIDAQTGNTIRHRDHMLNDQIVHQTLDRKAGKLELHGFKNRIQINFGKELQRRNFDFDAL